jgi:hypothetical protein
MCRGDFHLGFAVYPGFRIFPKGPKGRFDVLFRLRYLEYHKSGHGLPKIDLSQIDVLAGHGET